MTIVCTVHGLRQRVFLAAMAGALMMPSWVAAAKAEPQKDKLFDSGKVLHIALSIPANEIEALKVKPKSPVPATVTSAGRTYTNVTLHLKGLGSFEPIDAKPSFSIKFDPKQHDHLLGHSKILLENSSQDSTFLCRKLASEIYQSEGIPAARVTWALVELNGRELGLYTLSEAMNRSFLRRHFSSDAGNLYEGADIDITDNLEQDSGTPSKDRPEIQALIAACQQPAPETRWRLLQARLDVERFVTYAALEVLICHHDGYSLDLNNYRLYFDPTTRRFVFIPHGMDLIFDRPQLSIHQPNWKGIVAKAVMSTPEGEKEYRQKVRQLADKLYGGSALTNRIDQLVSFLKPSVELEGKNALAQFNEAVASLKERIQERSEFLRTQ